MHIGAETQSHQRHVERLMRSGKPMEKLDSGNDPRMIPFASILRATGIDELPQVLNIMKGDMSFVGPRPCVPYEYEKYEPRHRARLNAVPGLTGLWQVSGKNRTTFERMVQLDVEYSTCFSFWMDISIILRTFGALARQCKDLRERKKSASVSDGSFAGVSNCNLQKS
jgi:lipopolysaccharide/colanic/teichoic acid biosynthesis glycosyltransferase